MRIGLVVTGGFDRGGRERVVPTLLWLVERLARHHQVHVFVTDYYPEPCDYPLLGANVHDLGRAPGPPGLRRVRMRRRLADAIGAHGAFDVLHAYLGLPSSIVAPIALRLRTPTVLSLASGEFVAIDDINYGLQRRWIDRRALAQATRTAARVTVDTAFMAGLANAHGVETRVIPFGIDTRGFPLGIPDRRSTVAAAAGREPQSGQGLSDTSARARIDRPARPRRPPRRRGRRHHERRHSSVDANAWPRRGASHSTDSSRPIASPIFTPARISMCPRRDTKAPAWSCWKRHPPDSSQSDRRSAICLTGRRLFPNEAWRCRRRRRRRLRMQSSGYCRIRLDVRALRMRHASGRWRTTRNGPRSSSSAFTRRPRARIEARHQVQLEADASAAPRSLPRRW